MARGFESKAVADQQEAAQRERGVGAEERADPALQRTRRNLELARADVLNRTRTAHSEGHRRMLDEALRALDEQLAALDRRRR